MSHGRRGDPRCTATWPLTGEACRHLPLPGADTCAAHDPAGDQRTPPPPDEIRCTARCKESGERCRHGTRGLAKVCATHGGKARQVRERTREREVKALVVTYGLPIDITPEAALLAEVHRAAGHVAWLEAQIRLLPEDELTWGITRVKEGGDDRGTTREAQPHVYVRLYQAERAHLAKVCTDAIRNGIQDRQVKLAEQQGAAVAGVLRAILDGLDLTPVQKALALKIVPEQLRALQAAAPTN